MRVNSKFNLFLLALILISPVFISVVTASTRNYEDQLDDTEGDQFHVFYVIPSDGVDRKLDTDGTLDTSVNAFRSWFTSKTNYELRFDTIDGKLDITFYKSNQSNSEIKAYGAWVVTELEKELLNASLLVSNKKYLLYYDGESDWACGGAAWPPGVPGQSAAMYLQAKPDRPGYSVDCSVQAFVKDTTRMGYWEKAMLHDAIHTLGVVSTCAPNHAFTGHVSDDYRDLMYSGPLGWRPTYVDINNDDYFDHNNDCPDLKDSSYLMPEYTPPITPTPSETSSSTSISENTSTNLTAINLSSNTISDENPAVGKYSLTFLVMLVIVNQKIFLRHKSRQ